MSGGEKKNDGNGGGWMSTFFKVAGAAAATGVVAGGLYSAMKPPKAEQKKPEEEEGDSVWNVATAAATTVVVAGGLYSAMKQPKAERVAFESSNNEKQEEEEEEISVWTKPRIGWVKLNVDGSLLRHSASAGCGGVLRDSSGKWISGFAQKLDPTSIVDQSHQTEKEAILRGLQWADKRMGVRKLAVESDNEGVVYMVNRGPSNTNDPLICEIRKLLFRGRYEQATLTYIPRKANQVADKVASNSHGFSSFNLIEFDSPPANCRQALDGYY